MSERGPVNCAPGGDRYLSAEFFEFEFERFFCTGCTGGPKTGLSRSKGGSKSHAVLDSVLKPIITEIGTGTDAHESQKCASSHRQGSPGAGDSRNNKRLLRSTFFLRSTILLKESSLCHRLRCFFIFTSSGPLSKGSVIFIRLITDNQCLMRL